MNSPAAPTISPPAQHRPTHSAAISEALVRLLRESTGRGPTRARTVLAADLAVVTLLDCLTPAERTLADRGDGNVARRLRAAVHEEIRTEAVATVEAVTGKEVVAYLAAQEFDPDVAIIAFYFGPRS